MEREPLKITIDAHASGYTGDELAQILRQNMGEPEFYDNRFIVLMLTAQNTERDFDRLKNMFSSLKPKKPIAEENITLAYPKIKMSVREAIFKDAEIIDVRSAQGRVCAKTTVSCPPAVPIAISGEEITDEIIKLFMLYGIEKISVLKKEN